jgi:hypothetical protein
VTHAEVFAWMLRICAIGIAIDAIEQLWVGRNELFAWRVLRHRFDRAPHALRRAADVLCSRRGPALALAVRLASLVGVAAAPVGSAPFGAALSALFATQLHHFVRRAGFGMYGSDQMNLVVVGAAWLALVVDGTPGGATLALWFVAAQSCLSYIVNGAAKLVSQTWRSGRALPLVFGTHANGNAALYRALSARPRLGCALCWATMIWECAMPLVLVAPEPLRVALLVSGVLFHSLIAWTMGVHLFVWAFAAPYVAIWWCAA